MSEALKKQLIEECKRLDASYDPPVNHSIDEIRSDLKLIKSIHQKKRKTERIEKVRTDEVYAAGEREKNRERKHAQKKRMKVRQTHSAQMNVNASQRCGLVNLEASCFLQFCNVCCRVRYRFHKNQKRIHSRSCSALWRWK